MAIFAQTLRFKMADGAKPKFPPATNSGFRRNKRIPPELRKCAPRPGAGRPAKVIDWEQVGKWVMGGASGIQCAAQIEMNTHVFYERCQKDLGIFWSQFYDDHREKGNRLLHNKQFEMAMKGDKTMLIWLGKQRLVQSEKVETKMKIESPVKIYLPDNGREDPEKVDDSGT
jgi:hypothetical protein